MADQTTRWQPDPYGVHELRFFSADGKPTLLVMDGGKTSYDRPPATVRPPAAEPPSSLEPEAPRARDVPLAPPPAAVDTVQAVTPPTAHMTNTRDADSLESVAPLNRLAVAVPGLTADESDAAKHGVTGDQETLNRSLKVVYRVVLGALALSVLGLVYVHVHHSAGRHLTHADGTTTTTSASRTTTTTAVVLPTALQPSADGAATALVSNWATGNRSAALTVATPGAVATLFTLPYASGQALDRGCSTSFSPIVCTFGPPGGASPTDPIYEIDVTQATGGWYVSSVKTEN